MISFQCPSVVVEFLIINGFQKKNGDPQLKDMENQLIFHWLEPLFTAIFTLEISTRWWIADSPPECKPTWPTWPGLFVGGCDGDAADDGLGLLFSVAFGWGLVTDSLKMLVVRYCRHFGDDLTRWRLAKEFS